MSHPRENEVKALIEQNPVILFMKGTPDFPMCGFSARAAEALRLAGAKDYASFNVLEDRDLFEALKQYANWPTSPQLWVRGELIGGSDILLELYQKGELQTLVQSL